MTEAQEPDIETSEEKQPLDGSRLVRIAVALILLGLVLIALVGVFVDYQARVLVQAEQAAQKTTPSKPAASSKPATASVVATTTAKPAVVGKTLVVLIDGVNFRERPSGSSKIVTTLMQGDKLTLIEQQGTWLNAKTAKGVVGWLTSSSQYVKRQ